MDVAAHINNDAKPIMESFSRRLSFRQQGVNHVPKKDEHRELSAMRDEWADRVVAGGELDERNLFRTNMKEWNFFLQFY